MCVGFFFANVDVIRSYLSKDIVFLQLLSINPTNNIHVYFNIPNLYVKNNSLKCKALDLEMIDYVKGIELGVSDQLSLTCDGKICLQRKFSDEHLQGWLC